MTLSMYPITAHGRCQPFRWVLSFGGFCDPLADRAKVLVGQAPTFYISQLAILLVSVSTAIAGKADTHRQQDPEKTGVLAFY